jgi:hypothetical protein
MILAVKTTASPAELWAIVVVAVGCLAVWLYMVEVFATRTGPRGRDKEKPAELDSPVARAAKAATERVLEALQGLRPRAAPDRMAAGDPGARRPEGTHAGPAGRADSPPGEANDQRDQDRVVPWALPAQRQSPTDEPAPADPSGGRPGGGPREPG